MSASKNDKTAEHYNRSAEEYEERWANYLAHTHKVFLSAVHTNVNDCVLDLSCGTGLLAHHLINKSYPFKKMVLNDVATNMQQKAVSRMNGQSDIKFTNHSAEKLDFEDSTFTKVFCLNSFHNYRQQRRVLGECNRLLKRDGQLYILDWNCRGFFKPVNWMINLIGEEYIDSKSAKEIYPMLRQSGFNISSTKEWRFRYWNFYYVIAQKDIGE